MNGWLKYFGDFGAVLGVILIINTAGYCLSTQVCCLFYRFAVLQNSQWWMDLVLSTKSWVNAYLISLSVSILSFVIFAPLQPPQVMVKEYVRQDAIKFNYPQPLPNMDNDIFLYIDYRSDYVVAAAIFVGVGFFLAETVSIGCVLVLLKLLDKKKECFTRMTYKLHRQLTIALGVQCYDLAFSFILGILVNPDPLFPLPSAVIQGWFRYLGNFGAVLSLILTVNALSYCLSTQVSCLMYRFAAIQNTDFWLNFVSSKSSWINSYIVSLSISVLTYFIFAPLQPPQDVVHSNLLQNSALLSSPLPDLQNNLFLYLDFSTKNAVLSGGFLILGFILTELFSGSCVILVLVMLERKKDKFSRTTFKLHRQLTVALAVQGTVRKLLRLLVKKIG
ncbi:unnamed protein product [Bursaphelenchus okinawaensis]|uniref:Uncharacterized protein n=1 Tax=Bursaphelenchus okinawaensis TaxID=465554 RepID=A0A811KFD6_9BILA|nr:unnamed protein product [Bursaphelenchus okinawaensis]CAG9102082.1 unnamed protein product [Bursaphelenchus okinawaensis]